MAQQFSAMWFIMSAEAPNPLAEGGYTGTGITPILTHAKKAQIISRPEGYTSRARFPGFNTRIA